MVEADSVGPAEDAVRVVEAADHADVDVLGASDALAEGESGLVDQLADDAPEHEAGGVSDPGHMLAE